MYIIYIYISCLVKSGCQVGYTHLSTIYMHTYNMFISIDMSQYVSIFYLKNPHVFLTKTIWERCFHRSKGICTFKSLYIYISFILSGCIYIYTYIIIYLFKITVISPTSQNGLDLRPGCLRRGLPEGRALRSGFAAENRCARWVGWCLAWGDHGEMPAWLWLT